MADPQGASASTDRAQVKRRAASALRQAGRTYLADLGVRPVSSSPRQWLGDHGWWLINIEFQSSSWSVGSYLNVGVQYLWTVTDHRSFGHANPRVPIPGCEQFANLEGPESEVHANADAVGRAARDAALNLINHRQDDDTHMEWLSQATGTGLWDSVDAAIASGLLGRGNDASIKLADIQHSLDRTTDWQDKLATDCERLAALARDPARFRNEIDERIASTRQQLHLPPRTTE